MATSLGKGAQTMNSIYLKPVLRMGYHKKSMQDMASDTAKRNVEETKMSSVQDGASCWIRDSRTGIYYPKGQEKVMQDIPPEAAKDSGINWFSRSENV